MRDFFIEWFERLVGVIVVLMALFFVVAAFAASQNGGVLAFFGVLVMGAVYVVLMGGFMYLGLGIYRNTQRTAEATERMAGRVEGPGA